MYANIDLGFVTNRSHLELDSNGVISYHSEKGGGSN